MKQPEKIGHDMYLIDDFDLGRDKRTGTYVLLDEKVTLIETCASPSVPHILAGLEQLNVQPDDVAYIIVTHVHLDHAGAAGVMMEACKNAKLIVHPRGARHLADPTKLIQGARVVYGDKFDQLFSPVLPVPADRMIIKEDGETLQIGPDRTLTFYDTPGHARHHMSIHDSKSNGIFTGDTIGIYYRELDDLQVELYLPSTSPTQFHPGEMKESMRRIEDMRVDAIYFSHFGHTTNVQEVYKQISYWLPQFIQHGENALQQHSDFALAANTLKEELLTLIRSYLTEKGVPADHSVYEILNLDIEVCSMGIVDYLLKQKQAVK
ncbi:MBL fold metallo-hydrolase [Bacillus sp. 165]|uniref:MBL fold metallo-hydrolase n=1 Tax=Bacillus sp. 165 TaxID=1529117 RepID=UPI001ADC77CB|nr:MBL fold metallo-hydrolase [Bacillus sp. 165]MBO9129540.1 MBL fold metallo-hydrolase [Bacillus sp. 165]